MEKTKTIITTKEHFEKYAAMFKLKGDHLRDAVPFTKKEIEKALEDGDIHLNTLKLSTWDGAGSQRVGWTNEIDGKKVKSLAEQVCLLKHIAIYHIANYEPIFK